MNDILEFKSYYYNYLGIDKIYYDNFRENIFTSDQRNKPLALQFFQYLIITKIDGQIVYSIAPQFSYEFYKFIRSNKFKLLDDNLIHNLNLFFENRISNFNIRKMLRYSLDVKELPNLNINNKNIKALSEKDEEIFLNSGHKSGDRQYKKNNGT